MAEVSVIVPVYMVEEYLDRCVGSILRQTFEDFELILVDDGSPDRCPRMCDEWASKDGRIRVIHKENGGLSSARNAGVDAATGSFITFVDSDDWLEPDAVAHMLGLLKKYGADFSMAAMTRREGDAGKPSGDCRDCLLPSKEFIRRLLKIGSNDSIMYAHGKVYDARLFRTVRFKEGMTAEDLPATFWCALLSERVAVSERVVYHYFSNPESITRSGFSAQTFDMIRAADLVCQYAGRLGADGEVRQWAKINRERAGFGVLANLLVSDGYSDNYRKYKKEIDSLRDDLKRDLPDLLSAGIPMSRKAVMWVMCHAWNPAVPIANAALGMVRGIGRGARKFFGKCRGTTQ